ncbi:lysophospholipid acyltransferase family protein [Prauserella muralis]|uniref:Acyl-phosphate glycerol 3-phosphate acyltransferase n=1 Tax=Prauserella muralis TaxID=588067 RepID=A0A2V4BMX2_9PSEU|nr:lysophospholipid acyltransferase family protein [Prauserella muralis]PXY31993.1 acyl-phosphate glycerol 3-phosphate acyltransferase [Prauserella muralis]TWE13574.1 1-acyl-sn-glycerol-3-phosphate acyltransferase [Prauserella muralis]
MEAVTRLAALARALATAGPPDARARAVLDALDVRLDTDAGRLSVPGPTGTLIVANHVSWLDIVGLLAVEPATFLAKREVAGWPLLGRAATRLGTLFVDRWALRALPDSVAAVAAHLRTGRSVVVFPEATTWCSAPGGEFRRAVFQAALDAGAPVRPVSLEYLQGGRPSTIAAFVGDDTLARSVGRVARAAELTLRVRTGTPLSPEGDRRSLADRARRAVLAVEPAHA